MSQVRMDMSEYEALKKNEALLKEQLGREKKLNDEIKKLRDEKEAALVSAQKKIVKVSRVETTQHVIADFEHIAHRLVFVLAGQTLYGDPVRRIMAALQDAIKTTSTVSNNVAETVTVIGLDEAKEEIRKDLDKKMTEEMKAKLDSANEIQRKYADISAKLMASSRIVLDLEDANERGSKQLEETKETVSSILSVINSNVFPARKKIKIIKEMHNV